MGQSLHQALNNKDRALDERDDWLSGLEAIVADNEDPEHQHRIRVVIPTIDEDLVHDVWIRQMGVYVGAPGYGSFFLPPVGAEVVLFGRLGQKHNLYYLCVYNEDFIVPPDFHNNPAGGLNGGSVSGVRVPGDLKQIADGDYQLRAGRAHIESDSSISIIAPGGLFINGKRV